MTVDARRHAELLAGAVREVLAAGEPEVVVVGVGPGPFTGLRVGIMTGAAFGDARGLPVLGVCSLDGLVTGDGWAVTDARRKEVYFARYEGGRRVWGPLVDKPDQLRDYLARFPDEYPEAPPAEVLGDGALMYGLATGDEPRYPVMARLAEVAVRRHLAGEPPVPLTPLYLRRPDAVEPSAPKRVTA